MAPKQASPTAGQRKQAELAAKKEAARLADALAAASNFSWLDRVAKEMKAQREWSDRWGALNDPKLYRAEDTPEAPIRAPPTKWSAYSIINTPKRNPLSSRPSSAEEYPNTEQYNNFKVTGARHDYLSHHNARHPNHPTPNKSGTGHTRPTETTTYDREYGGRFEFNHKTGLYHRVMDGNGSGPPGKPPIHQHQSNSGRTSTIPTSSRTPSQQSNYSHIIPPKRKSHGSIHSTPNSSTPSSRAPSSLAKTTIPSPTPDPSFVVTNGVSNLNLDANEIVYPNGNRVRLRGIMPHLPADRYNYPASTNMEYGWYRKSLEIYGSTSADFAKESWKRAMETQK